MSVTVKTSCQTFLFSEGPVAEWLTLWTLTGGDLVPYSEGVFAGSSPGWDSTQKSTRIGTYAESVIPNITFVTFDHFLNDIVYFIAIGSGSRVVYIYQRACDCP